MDRSALLALYTAAILLLIASGLRSARGQGAAWLPAHATFYADVNRNDSIGGACGYENVLQQGYGILNAALSTALFDGGAACGSCYEIRCVNSPQACIPNAGSITVTATNFCPPANKPNNDGGWCNPPLRHFDLNFPAYLKIGVYRAGIIPVEYRRVPCVRAGGVKFELKGNPSWISVLVYNVAGDGEVKALSVQSGSGAEWLPLKRNWGQIWELQGHADLVGKGLSFRVTASDGRTVESDGVVPPGWRFGQSFEGKQF